MSRIIMPRKAGTYNGIKYRDHYVIVENGVIVATARDFNGATQKVQNLTPARRRGQK